MDNLTRSRQSSGTDWSPSLEDECNERFLIARLVFDEFGEREVVLRQLRAPNFSFRAMPWFTAVQALHAGPQPIDVEALLARVSANGIRDAFGEWLLITAEIPDNANRYEDLPTVAEHVIAASRRQWFFRAMQSALLNAQRKNLSDFDRDIATATRLAHEMVTSPSIMRERQDRRRRFMREPIAT